MGFQIYQIEKSQAVNLLDRIANRLMDQNNEVYDEDTDTAIETVTRLCRDTDAKKTQLNREIPMDLAELMSMLRGFDDSKRGNAVEYFARYFSNFNTDESELLLAAHYALPERDELLRECVHHVRLADDCCLDCDCGPAMAQLHREKLSNHCADRY